MGEEQKEEEQKKEETPEEKKEEVPEEIVLKVDMHCEGCARRVQRSLRGFEGVEDVVTDCKTHKVVVKGKTADPVKVCERIQRKSGRKAEIISPLPKPPEEEKEKKEDDKDKAEEKKEGPPPVITVTLKVGMHCEACAQVLQKRIRNMEGVESVETDIKTSQVIVKGVVDPEKLVERVYKRTRKQASVVKDEKEEEKKEEEKKVGGEGGEKKEGEEDKDHNATAKKSEYWPPKYYIEYVYPPEIFSDENPHACYVM
ncbi:heavy metal-associated isoprenylated plant protein 7-like isoform X2 [Aristolochia californica]|uniref:heavy metal-associated isoprenylated plant protein 7-like isoform X2 n=1 Tax=Aristolochia californica TaxID=171875 RepID=UPI0035DC4819